MIAEQVEKKDSLLFNHVNYKRGGRPVKKKPPIQLSPNRVIALGFLGILLAREAILSLHISKRIGRSQT